MQPTIGRIVHYRLTAEDAMAINRPRVTRPHQPGDYHGNIATEGESLPMIIVRVWPNKPGVNGQIYLDGDDQFWVSNVQEGTEPGTWSWPPKV